jgi:hypothetical protein
MIVLRRLAGVRAENVVRARCDPKLIGDGRWSGGELDVQGVRPVWLPVVSSAGWPAGGPDCLSGLAVAGTGLFLPRPAWARSDRRSSSLWGQDASVYSLTTPLTLLWRRSRKLSRSVTAAGSGLRGAAWLRERCGRWEL